MQTEKRTRRKPIKSCLECNRRKQKCNRQRPCNHCISRRVKHLCVYTTSSATSSTAGNSPRERRNRVRRGNNHPLPIDNTERSSSNTLSPNGSDSDTEQGTGTGTGTGKGTLKSESLNSESHVLQDPSIDILSKPDPHRSRQWGLWPRKSMTDFLLRIFLDQINRLYEVIHGPSFETKYASWWNKQEANDMLGKPIADDDIDFGILIIRSCLLSLQTLPSPKYPTSGVLRTHPEAVEQWLYTLANDLDKSQAPDRRPCLETVQHRFFHTGYSKNYGKIRESWSSLSAAVKDAHEMGLHLKDPGIQLDSTEMEVRRRTFWNLYFWDRFMCTFFGHWPLIPEGYFDIEPPHDNLQPLTTTPYVLTTFTDHIFHIKIARYITAFLSPPSWTSDQYIPATVADFAERFDQVIIDQLPPPLWMVEPDTTWDSVDPVLIIKRTRLQLLIASTKSSLYRAFADPCNSLQPLLESKDLTDPLALAHRRSLIESTSNMISMITQTYILIENEGGGPPAERLFLLPIYLVDALASLGVSLLSIKFDERRFLMAGIQTIIHPNLLSDFETFLDGFDLLCRQASLYSIARRGVEILGSLNVVLCSLFKGVSSATGTATGPTTASAVMGNCDDMEASYTGVLENGQALPSLYPSPGHSDVGDDGIYRLLPEWLSSFLQSPGRSWLVNNRMAFKDSLV